MSQCGEAGREERCVSTSSTVQNPRKYLEEHKLPLYGAVIGELEEDDTAALKITSQVGEN